MLGSQFFFLIPGYLPGIQLRKSPQPCPPNRCPPWGRHQNWELSDANQMENPPKSSQTHPNELYHAPSTHKQTQMLVSTFPHVVGRTQIILRHPSFSIINCQPLKRPHITWMARKLTFSWCVTNWEWGIQGINSASVQVQNSLALIWYIFKHFW